MINDKDSGSIDNIMTTIIESTKAHLTSVSTGVHLAFAELRLVVSHAGLIICLVIVAVGMSLVGWGLLLVLGALLLMKLGSSAVVAVLCVLLVNTLALVGIGLAIRNTLDHLSFKHTRQAINPEGSELAPAR